MKLPQLQAPDRNSSVIRQRIVDCASAGAVLARTGRMQRRHPARNFRLEVIVVSSLDLLTLGLIQNGLTLISARLP